MTATALNTRPTKSGSAYRYNQSEAADNALAKLPLPALKKLNYLRDVEMRAQAMRDGLYTAWQTCRQNLDAAKRDLGNFDKSYPPMVEIVDDPTSPNGKKRVEVERRERKPLAANVERLQEEIKRITDQQMAAAPGFSVGEIIDYLSAAEGEFIVVPPPKVVIEKGADTLASLRAKQSTIRDEISAVTNAPATAAEAKARMRADVAAIAENGSPNINLLFGGGSVQFPEETLIVDGRGHHPHSCVATVKNTFALLVYLAQDALVRKLEEAIDAAAESADVPAISSQDRASRLNQLQKSLIDLERREEAVIVKLEENGGIVTRVNRDPLTLLGIERK